MIAGHLSKSIRSDCIDINGFSINPNLVAVDRNQASLMQLLEKQGLDVILEALQNVGAAGSRASNFRVSSQDATVSENLGI